MKGQEQAGMSLIELAVIITILGILAAVILSRLVLMNNEARTAVDISVRGAFAGGISAAHNQWLAESQPNKVALQDVVLSMNNTGWPEAVSEDANGYVTPEKCLEIWNAIMQNPPLAGITCTGKCTYMVTVIKGSFSNRMECLYTNRLGAANKSLYYDMATGFVH